MCYRQTEKGACIGDVALGRLTSNNPCPLAACVSWLGSGRLVLKVSSCQGGYAPPSLGVRVALRMKHALDFGARSALMLINHSLLPRCAMLRGAQARLELAYGLQAKIMLNDYGYAPSTCEPL